MSDLNWIAAANTMPSQTTFGSTRPVAIQFSGVSYGYCNFGGSARAHTHSCASLMTTSSAT